MKRPANFIVSFRLLEVICCSVSTLIDQGCLIAPAGFPGVPTDSEQLKTRDVIQTTARERYDMIEMGIVQLVEQARQIFAGQRTLSAFTKKPPRVESPPTLRQRRARA
jgi:hypothetical protein